MMPGISSENLSEKTTTALIQAMRHGNLEAISRVPRLLSLLSLSPSARGVFSVSVARGEVPAWVFVPWVSQMVGSLDLAEGEAIAPVLVKVAEAYPQAVFYPLNVSSKKAQAQARRLSEPIWAILDRACPLLRKFVRACELSVHPEHRAKDAVAEIKALRQEGKTPEIELRRALQELAEDCFNDADPSLGKYNVEKAKEWKLQLRKEKMAFSPDVLPPLSWLDRIAQIVAADKKPERPAALQAYSRWMAAYHAMDSSSNSDNGTSFLEVPGQYNKLGVRPAPERHSMITSFESNVLVMSSLRCPKRIGIVTNDSGIKHFLLKGGEDLRLDERIEQAFTLTNGFLASSDKAQRGLEISTYSVVPLSYRAGIIEWVHGTETFKSLVTKQFIKMVKPKQTNIIFIRFTVLLTVCAEKGQGL